MMRLAWITDPHLNFLDDEDADAFCASLAEVEADTFAITGDIGEAPDVAVYLNALGDHVGRPVYFVLGNHDFYRGSFAEVRGKIPGLCEACPNLHWMPAAGVVPLTEKACLVGHDGWADGRHGDAWGSNVELNDWALIGDFMGLDKARRIDKLNALGVEAAAHFRAVLPDALARFEHVVVLTHVPPFPEGCLWEGKVTNADWLPHVCCKAVGDVLREAMAASPDRRMTVLCGHTHQPADAQVLPNLRIVTGGAEYYKPRLQRVLDVE